MLPVNKPLLGSAQQQYQSLHLKVFVGGSSVGFGELYEDKGDDIGYLNNQYACSCLFSLPLSPSHTHTHTHFLCVFLSLFFSIETMNL
jgi:hypothetical protein